MRRPAKGTRKYLMALLVAKNVSLVVRQGQGPIGNFLLLRGVVGIVGIVFSTHGIDR